MSVNEIKQNTAHAWNHPQARSDQFLKQNPKTLLEQQASMYASTLTSLNPVESAEKDTKTESIDAPADKPKGKGMIAWLDSQWKSLLALFGKKTEVASIDVQQDCVKKSNAVPKELAARSTALKKSTQEQPLQSTQLQKQAGFFDQVGDLFKEIGDWFKEKWESFLDLIGEKSPEIKIKERDKNRRIKILERQSPHEIEEDFKYVDVSQVDPLKTMLTVLVKQGQLSEEQAFLVQQKALLRQEDLKDLHDQRMQIHAELALVGKRSGVIEKVNIVITVGQVLAGVATTATMVTGAAAMVSFGASAPAAVYFGAISAVLNGVVYTGKALNTWLSADTKEKMNKLQGDMLLRDASRDEKQFQLKVDVKDMKKIVDSFTSYAEIGSSVLSAQHGK